MFPKFKNDSWQLKLKEHLKQFWLSDLGLIFIIVFVIRVDIWLANLIGDGIYWITLFFIGLFAVILTVENMKPTEYHDDEE